MILQLTSRMLRTTDPRLLWKFAYNCGFKGVRSVQRFKKRLKQGINFPPFIYISITNACNLRCQGCWIDVEAPQANISFDDMNKLISTAKKRGNSFFGILGGEPFMHPELLDIIANHPDCYFQVFTNGQFITDDVAKRLRKLGNVTPLISIEGSEIVSDERRGRLGVLNKTLAGLEACMKNKLITGVATSVCQTNLNLVTEDWLDELIRRGVHYCWFHTYRPVGPDASPELALSPAESLKVRQFVVKMRSKKPIAIIDAYWNDKGEALCPAAIGISHHIGPWGDVEPCPIIQLATENIRDNDGDIYKTLTESKYLADFRKTAAKATRGCIVLERPDLLLALASRHQAGDTTARKRAFQELEAMESRPSQHNPGNEVPESHWAYRFAKKHWFFGFGAYT